MKSWKKLKEFARFKEKPASLEPTQDIEEITKGLQDVQHMKTQYEGLHAVTSRVAGRAYGFSEAIQEMATFLVNTFGLADENGEINQVFKEVGKAQSELSRLLHLYALHVSGTLTVPTESLLNELSHIEETKKHYDEKRASYDYMRLRKLKVKNGKFEVVDQQLQESKEQFDELAMVLGCRLHSVEQSRPRKLITQAVRHHAAQMHLFRQGLGNLEDLDPFISRLVQDRNIDQTLDYLDDASNAAISSKTIMTEESDHSSVSEQETSPKQFVEDSRGNNGAHQPTGSRSAPISPIRFTESNGINSIHEVMLDGVSKKPPLFTRTNSWLRRKGNRDPGVLHVYRQSPTGAEKANRAGRSQAYCIIEPPASPVPSWVKNAEPAQLAAPRRKKLSSFPSFPHRYAQSGPLVSAASATTKPLVPSSGPLPQPRYQALPLDPLYKSGPLNPTPKMSPNASPPSASPPRVSELHRLPPPPLDCTGCCSSSGPAKLIPHSAPLNHHQQQQNHHHQVHHYSQASPLPPPPLGAQSQPPKSSSHKPPRKNEERVSPLPLSLSPTN